MAQRFVCLAAVLLLAGMGGCSGPTAPDPAPRLESGGGPSPMEVALLDLTNAERKRAGLTVLAPNAQLMIAAQLQAEQVAAVARLEHTLPGTRHPTLEERLAAVGYRWRLAGENLAFGQRTAAAVVETWMTSTSHKANILNERFTQVGTAFLADPNGRLYYVQVFGQPPS